MKKSLLVVLLIGICSFFVGCNIDDGDIDVISTTGMINDIVIQLAGEFVDAKSLMGPGVDPHAYKASAGDVKKLYKADLVLYNGLHLEAKMTDIFEQFKAERPAVAVSKLIDKNQLISPEDYDGLYDPHIWFDVKLWIAAVEVVKNELITLIPQHESVIKQNYFRYVQQLSQLNDWVHDQLNQIPSDQRILVTAHDAFGYFGRAYNMEVVGIQGISTLSEPSVKDIQLVTNIVVEKKVPTIFIESSVPVKSIKALRDSVENEGFTVSIGDKLYADALGNKKSGANTYVGMIKYNVSTIVAGLKK